MFKGIVIASVLLIAGCGSFGGFFGPDGELPPFAAAILAKCETVPVAEFDNCVKTELDATEGVANPEALTVADLLALFAAMERNQPAPAPE